MLIPVILSGGSGTRLWPLSRELYPKQLLPLCRRAHDAPGDGAAPQGLENLGAPVVVCNEAHRFMVAEQLRQLRSSRAPVRSFSSPSGATRRPRSRWRRSPRSRAGREASAPIPMLLVLPADHVIDDVPAFHAACPRLRWHRRPTKNSSPSGSSRAAPETGYGYIRQRGGRGRGVPRRAVRRKARLATCAAVHRSPASTSGTAACSCSGAPLSGGARAPCAGHARSLRDRRWRRAGGPGIHAADRRRIRSLAAATRSTTR